MLSLASPQVLEIYRKKAARPRTPARPAPDRAAALPAPAVAIGEVASGLLPVVVGTETPPVPTGAVVGTTTEAVPLG